MDTIQEVGRTRTLMGDRVFLRPLVREDLRLIRRWSKDPEFRGLIGEIEPMSEAEAEDFFQRVQTQADRLWFMVVRRSDDRPIGETGLLRMFPAWRTTDLSLMLGERDAWGQGYGTEAIRLLLDHAFGVLKMHRVSLGVVGFNERALRFYEKVGFRREGVQRDGYCYEGRFHDFVMMSILEDEYRALQ